MERAKRPDSELTGGAPARVPVYGSASSGKEQATFWLETPDDPGPAASPMRAAQVVQTPYRADQSKETLYEQDHLSLGPGDLGFARQSDRPCPFGARQWCQNLRVRPVRGLDGRGVEFFPKLATIETPCAFANEL